MRRVLGAVSGENHSCTAALECGADVLHIVGHSGSLHVVGKTTSKGAEVGVGLLTQTSICFDNEWCDYDAGVLAGFGMFSDARKGARAGGRAGAKASSTRRGRDGDVKGMFGVGGALGDYIKTGKGEGLRGGGQNLFSCYVRVKFAVSY